MNLQKDLLLGFLAPLVVSFLLMLITRPSKHTRRLWLIPFFIALIYPITLWLRLGNHVWPIADSLDRLIVIIPSFCLGIALLTLVESRLKFGGTGVSPVICFLYPMLIGALIALGIRKTNSSSVWNFALWIACASVITSAISICIARFVKRDDSLLMPILLAGASLAVAGYVSATGSITLSQSTLPFAGLMMALLAISLLQKKSILTPTMSAGFVMILSIFVMGSFWWTSSFTSIEFPESIFLLALPLLAWLKLSPVIKNREPIKQTMLIVILAAGLAGFVVARKQIQTIQSFEESTHYYDLDE